MSKRASLGRTASLTYENYYRGQGYRLIMGVDEAGRGPWAGPVSAGAVCLPLDNPDLMLILAGVRDSKQMTPGMRTRLAVRIREVALAWGVGSASAEEIDQNGIMWATRAAMRRAIEAASIQPDLLLIDWIKWDDCPFEKHPIKKGDSQSLSIAAASVLAKVWRDDYMREQDSLYPVYGFAAHKGYGTERHIAALREHGPSPIHRLSFAPVRAARDAHS